MMKKRSVMRVQNIDETPIKKDIREIFLHAESYFC